MPFPEIKLFGSENCHKTIYYKGLLKDSNMSYKFLDVVSNEEHAVELRELYNNKKLNFPTLTIGKKKLRNPGKEELFKWIDKLKS